MLYLTLVAFSASQGHKNCGLIHDLAKQETAAASPVRKVPSISKFSLIGCRPSMISKMAVLGFVRPVFTVCQGMLQQKLHSRTHKQQWNVCLSKNWNVLIFEMAEKRNSWKNLNWNTVRFSFTVSRSVGNCMILSTKKKTFLHLTSHDKQFACNYVIITGDEFIAAIFS